jgi:hypothetical protein
MSIATTLNPYMVYVKIGAVVLVLGAAAAAGFHFGGLSADDKLANYKTEVQAQNAANLKTVADTLNAQIKDGAIRRAAMQVIIDAYDLDKAKPPITAGLAGELRDAARAASCPASSHVSQAGSVAGGTQGATAKPGSGPSAERLSGLVQDVFDTSDADAKQMIAMIKLAP